VFSDEDAASLNESIEKGLGKEEKINLLTNTVNKEGGKQVITIEIETKDLTQFEDLLAVDDPSDGTEKSKSDQILETLLGKLLLRREGLSAGINRKVDLGPLLDKFVGERWPAMVGDSEFRYTIHFPDEVKTSNAHEVLNDGRTLVWNYKLVDCKEGAMELDMVVPIPVPRWVYVIVVLCAIFLLFGILLLIRKLSKG